jgi:hypothetical protein
VRCVKKVLDGLPETATIGVVTPYKPQANALQRLLREFEARVRVGTAHKFQGGERDVMVLSLVAADNAQPRAFDWADQQRELWNVAITRARSHLIVVGDENVWTRRGGVGSDLLAAARSPAAVGDPLDQDLLDRLYDTLSTVAGASVELGVAVNGYRTDAVVSTSGRTLRLLVDPGPSGPNTGTHLSQVLRRWALLGDDAVRIPAWWLYDVDKSVANRIVLGEPPMHKAEAPSHR